MIVQVILLQSLRKDLDKTRKRGWACGNEEFLEGMNCVSAPVLNQFELPVAMISISGPKFRLPSKKMSEYGALIAQLAMEISQWFGYKNQ